ncbi:MAG: cysteine desulfurase family protein [Syntrophales bacterium]|nr:cysteine desulfurase family protein [Syntrophales bacterium]
MEAIYLDHCATTPLDPEVMGSMMRYFGNIYGNPGSNHAFGRLAKKAVDDSRRQVAALLGGVDPEEIIFTGGGTEADNLAVLGIAAAASPGKNHIVTSAVEHPAVMNACRHLETKRFSVTYLPVDGQGIIDPADVAAAITDKTRLISIMHGNNEVGVIEPLAAICALARERGVPVHTDAVQTAGKIPFDMEDLPVDCLSLAAHKIYGPKGMGALYVRRGTSISPRSFGGSQERGLRAGTENVPGIVGLGKACEIALRDMALQMDHTRALRDRLQSSLKKIVPEMRVNAGDAERLPHVLSVSFHGIAGESLVQALDREGIAVSAGAACHAGTTCISHVIEAMRVPRDYALGTVRFSVGKGNTAGDIERAIEVVSDAVSALRKQH